MGSIQERKGKNGDKTYLCQIRIKGSRAINASFKRKTDASRWIQQTETEIRNGRYFDTHEAKKHTLSDLIERYKKDYFSERKSLSGPEVTLRWWTKQLGHLSLDQLSTRIFREHWEILSQTPSARTGRLLKNRTLNSYLETLSAMYTVAVREYGWVEDNPIIRIKKKPLKNARTRFLDKDELTTFLKAVRNDMNTYLVPAILLSLSTGGRQEEVWSLKWKDVDMKDRRVTFRDTKNGETRSVAFGEAAFLALNQHRKIRRLDSEYVFPARRHQRSFGQTKNSKPWENLYSAFRRARDKAGIVDFNWHDMRHCAASYFLASGASLAEVGKILGHRSPQMTWRYAHLVQSKSDELVSAMSKQYLDDIAA